METYKTCFEKYITSINENLNDIEEGMKNPNCPEWLKQSLIKSYHMLKYRKHEYLEMNQEIMRDPSKHEKDIQNFLRNVHHN
jgi:hypothetical protein